ncbi:MULTISPECIES: hypothetical protein [Pseudomonas]|uniref:Uncharacterized protein n=2 Tax=Pseudomonas TaxID=286 RepID=A0ABX6HCG4_9PSED|nr:MULTISPECIES: hypothetical protein [Pseudomonas]MBC3953605.1 hypothetical protein [Pseudomonas triticifolii]QHF03279.1 hypothetical protein N015_13030 [Pseudomonas asturiensis]
MDIEVTDDWPCNPTEEQMIRQHVNLVSEENRLLPDEVARSGDLLNVDSTG